MQYTTKKPDVQAVNGKEMCALEFLAAFDEQMKLDEKVLEERLRSIPNGWRNFRMIRTQHHLLMDALYDTMPDTKRWRLDRTITTGQLIMRPRARQHGAQRDDRTGQGRADGVCQGHRRGMRHVRKDRRGDQALQAARGHAADGNPL